MARKVTVFPEDDITLDRLLAVLEENKKIKYTQELEFETLDMMGATDEELKKIMTEEEFENYKKYLAGKSAK